MLKFKGCVVKVFLQLREGSDVSLKEVKRGRASVGDMRITYPRFYNSCSALHLCDTSLPSKENSCSVVGHVDINRVGIALVLFCHLFDSLEDVLRVVGYESNFGISVCVTVGEGFELGWIYIRACISRKL